MKIRELILTALMAAMICVFSPWVIPIGPVPVTLATFSVYVAAATLGAKRGALAVVVYILIGAVGLPVFSGFTGGVQKLVSITGGYLVGYIPCAFIIGFLVERQENRKAVFPLAMVLGCLGCYAFGLIWYMISTGTGLLPSLAVCVVPFLPWDGIKIAAASALCIKLRPIIRDKITA